MNRDLYKGDSGAVTAAETTLKVIQKQADNINSLNDQQRVMDNRISQIKGLIKLHAHSNSEAKATLKGLGTFLQDIQKFKQSRSQSGQFTDYDFVSRGLNNKAATTQDDGNAGFLLPDVLLPGVQAIKDAVIGLLPLIPKIQMPPGTTLKINKEATRVSASWRMTECTDIPETALLLEQNTIEPALLGGIVPVSQELFNYPGAGFGELVAATALAAVMAVEESGLLQADDSVGGAAAPPSDGILVDANVQDFAAGIALPGGYAELLDFVQYAIDAVPSLYNAGVLILHPVKAINLLKEAAAATTLNGGLGATMPAQIGGLSVIYSEFSKVSTVHNAIILDPNDIIAGEAAYRFDVNPYGSGWTTNCVSLKCYSYFDWALIRPDRIFKADYLTS